MSQSSNSTFNTKALPELSASKANNKVASAEAEKGKKRSAPLSSEGQVKKRIADYGSCEQQAVGGTVTSVDQLKFVSAAEAAVQTRTHLEMTYELSDQELLEMAIQLEKEYPQ